MTERAFQTDVVDFATLLQYRHYHTYDSRHSVEGFPDLVLARAPRLLFVELKAERGKLADAQIGWLLALEQCADAEVYVWRPTDWDAIIQTLQPRERPTGYTSFVEAIAA